MTAEEVDRYLEDQILGRLAADGWLKVNGEGQVAFAGELWRRIDADRSAFAELIEREIEQRLRAPSKREEAEAPVAGGSRLTTEGLVKIYKKRRVVDDVDLELRQGEIVGLLGPNGAGKTTTFYMIVGLVAPDAGEVYIDDEKLANVPMYKRAHRGIGYLSQEPSVFRKLTVEQNIIAILETLPLSDSERRERLDRLLDELSIKHLRRNKAYSLSGGERRRLEITRALVTDPKFMLLDEPFAGVDPIAVDDIQRIVADLKGRGLGVLITDHNVRETLSITDRAYIMFDGRIHIEGTSEELVNDPQARKLYLGEDFRL
ncbi:MAG: LPS export ABC transporter ATP-binding protein [Gemmatimonadota bacterium]|nr:MAG: LPS export ABC transporter ATP-binding protein [Gemmatimonadota bacterium]